MYSLPKIEMATLYFLATSSLARMYKTAQNVLSCFHSMEYTSVHERNTTLYKTFDLVS
jgi:hypothetical protein